MRDIVIKITPTVSDFTMMKGYDDRIGFPTDINYGDLKPSRIVGVHTIEELAERFTDIISCLSDILSETKTEEGEK